MDLRWIILLLSHYLLLFLTAEANHLLGLWTLHLLPAGLYVAYAGMRFNPRAATAATLGAGLLLDASHPAPWGVQTFSLLLLLAILLQVRERLGIGERWQLTLVASMATPLHHLALALTSAPGQLDLSVYALRCVIDCVLSIAFVLLAGPWWFSLQSALLELLGFSRRDERAELT